MRRSVCAAVVALLLLSRGAQAKLNDADTRALAEMALAWVIDGGLSDFKLVKDPANLVVASTNLPPKTELRLPGHKVVVISPLRIQVHADVHGDYLYFQLTGFTGNEDHASLGIALVWAVSVNSTAQYLSGGGATLEFEKRDGKWAMLPVTNKWKS